MEGQTVANSFGRTKPTEFWASPEKRILRSIWYSTEFTLRTGTACSELRDRAAQNGMDLDVEHRILLPDGVIRYLHVVAHAGEDRSGNREYIGIVSDITERKRAEYERQALARELEESKARLEAAQRVAHIGHYQWDLIANRMAMSDELYRIYGLPPQEEPLDIAIISEMLHPEDRERCFRTAEEYIRSGVQARLEVEHRIVRPDGEVRTIMGLGTVKRDASGQSVRIFWHGPGHHRKQTRRGRTRGPFT